MELLKQDIEQCRKIHKKHGKSYYFATKFFPKEIREATYVLYAFFRIPDEIVDNPLIHNDTQIRDELEQWKSRWQKAFENKNSPEPVLRATAAVFHTYGIPFELSESFLAAMIQDTWKKRYKTPTELEEYMYGSAAVVGLMMTYVIGFDKSKEEECLRHAKELGYAMQLTNFLRDISEDYFSRDRIYMPEEEWGKFHLSEKNIKEKIIDENFKNFMKFEINKTRSLYQESLLGIPLLNKEGRFAVRAAAQLYGAILNKIEEANYDVFSRRVKTTLFEKISLLMKLI